MAHVEVAYKRRRRDTPRNRSLQTVVRKIQHREVRPRSERIRYPSSKTVPSQIQIRNRRSHQTPRNRAGDQVPVEIERREHRHFPQRSRDRAGDSVHPELKIREPVDPGQRFGYLTRDSVTG